MSTCINCQAFLGVGEKKLCAKCLPRWARRCQGCRVLFVPDTDDKFCQCCRNTELLPLEM